MADKSWNNPIRQVNLRQTDDGLGGNLPGEQGTNLAVDVRWLRYIWSYATIVDWDTRDKLRVSLAQAKKRMQDNPEDIIAKIHVAQILLYLTRGEYLHATQCMKRHSVHNNKVKKHTTGPELYLAKLWERISD